MSVHATDRDPMDDTDTRPRPTFDERDVRAACEHLLVDESTTPPGMADVYGETGCRYRVDVVGGACECDDAFYRNPTGGCKHLRRVEMERGERAIPWTLSVAQLDVVLAKRRGLLEDSP